MTAPSNTPASMPARFSGRTAIVTGASRGIGLAVAERLVAEGANVVITLAAIYGLNLGRLNLPADRVLFLDDAEPHVLGARAAGIRALWHTDAETTRAALAEFFPALSPAVSHG